MTTVSPTLIRDPWQRTWHALSGDRWLAALLLALAALLLAVALLPQTPQNDPVAYSRWLSETQQRFGSLTAPLISLGLFSVIQSIGFRLLAALLALSAALRLIESVERWRTLRRLPERPTAPTFDRVAEIDREAVQAQLHGYAFRADGELNCRGTISTSIGHRRECDKCRGSGIVDGLGVGGGCRYAHG